MKTSSGRLAEIVKNRYTKAKELFDPVCERVEMNKALYKGDIQTDEQYEWDYSLVDQQTFPLIRNYISRSNPSMTKVRLEARKSEDFEKRKVNQDFVNWEINELSLTSLLTRGFFSNYIAGRSYFKSGWKHDPRIVANNGVYETEMRPLINRADLKFVRFNNILIPNRNIPTIYEQPYYIELEQLRVGDMIKDNETFGYEYWDEKFIKKLRKAGVTSKALDFEADFVEDSDTMDEMTFRAATFPAACMHTLEGDVIHIPLVDDPVIINKDQGNRFWHGHYDIIEMVAFPEDDEYFSMSVVDATGDTQIASTEVLNQTLTNIRALNNNMYITGESNVTTPDWMFTQRPNGIIRIAGDPQGTVPLPQRDGTNSMLKVSQELNTKFERTGGISSLYASGSANTKTINQTARGAQIIDNNIENNIKMILDLFGEQVLKRVGEHFLELNAQFVTEEQTFAITGKKGVRELVSIDPAQITANFDVYVQSEAMIKQTPASRQASLQNLVTVLNQQALPAGVSIDMVPIVQNLVDSYPEMENIEDVVVSVDEKVKRDWLMIERGQMPEIKVRDDHMSLMQAISVHFEQNKMNYTPEISALFEQYIQEHLQYLMSEQELKQMMKPPAIPTDAGVGGGNIPGAMGMGGENQYDLGNLVGQV